MIKVILFDCDGPIIKRDKYFSQRLEDLGMLLDKEKVHNFFNNEFLLCGTGKADLKEELSKRVKDWGWNKSVQDLLDFWFSGEAKTDPEMVELIGKLRQKGIKCHLVTDQEKYRTEYLLSVVGLKNILENIYPSWQVGYLKRQTEFWEEIFKGLQGTLKDEILVLDDDRPAIESAKLFGFNAEFYVDFESFEKVIKEKYQIN